MIVVPARATERNQLDRGRLWYTGSALEIEIVGYSASVKLFLPCRKLDISFLRQIKNRKKTKWNKEL
jgi:hypothetical protein